MGKRRRREGRPVRWFDFACAFSYELGLLLAVVTLILAAIHGAATYHAALDEVVDFDHVAATVSDPGRFEVGAQYPIYRYDHDWEGSIGTVQAESILDGRVVFRYDPSRMVYPMGRHGRIIRVEGNDLYVNVGTVDRFTAGQVLAVFDQRNRIGGIQLTHLWPHEAEAIVSYRDGDMAPAHLAGKTVSEYTLATQVTSVDQSVVTAIDVILYGAVLFAYVYCWIRYRASLLSVIGPKTIGRLHPPAWLKTAVHILLGPATLWFVAKFFFHCITYLSDALWSKFGHGPSPAFLSEPALRGLELPLGILLSVAYEVVLFVKKTSPFALFARLVAYRGGLFGHPAQDVWEHIGTWFMQAIVVFTFARMLAGFIQGNLQLAISQSWQHATPIALPGKNSVSVDGFMRSAVAIGYCMTHRPTPANVDMGFATLRGFINDACILGGMFGYAYSMLAYLWRKRIRSVDFTIAGWLLNAICYAPLLGAVLWRMVPSQVGADPTVTIGPFRVATLGIEAFANVVYTLSIYNLGTMFGVMTDKGVRRSGFYSAVRHPSYTIEAFMFVLVFCRGLSTPFQWIAVFCYFVLYWLRSEREDQFMTNSNPEFADYCKQVPYKFFPGIY